MLRAVFLVPLFFSCLAYFYTKKCTLQQKLHFSHFYMQGQKIHIGIILPHCASLQSKIAGVENALHTLFFYDHYQNKITSCQSTYKKTKGWILKVFAVQF